MFAPSLRPISAPASTNNRMRQLLIALILLQGVPIFPMGADKPGNHLYYSGIERFSCNRAMLLADEVGPNFYPRHTSTYENSDKSERSKFDYVFWGFWVNLLLVLATLAIAVFAVVQGIATKRSADALVASERAWIMVDIEKDGTGFVVSQKRGEEYSTSVSLIFNLVNRGKTPARITELRAKLIMLDSVDSLDSVPPKPDFSDAETIRSLPRHLPAGNPHRAP
jgi:hypothetical protein